MDISRQPAPHLVQGLRRLIQDISVPAPLPGHGLTGIPCGTTALISFQSESLQYCGEPIEELVSAGCFERVIWLLLTGGLPEDEQLADIQSVLNDAAVIDVAASEMLERIPVGTRPLDLFPLSISLLSFFDPTPHDQSAEATRSRVWRLLAQLPLMLAAGLGKPLHYGTLPNADEAAVLSWAGRLLLCLRDDDRLPTPAEDAAMNAVMICECLTEMRPACFAARFAGSTVNHIVAALQAASSLYVSQLRNDPFEWTCDLLRTFQGPAAAEAWWRRREGQSMPFGFSDTVHDPRPQLLRDVCRSLLGSHGRIVLEASACRLERLLAAQQLYPTIDWVAARAMTLLNIPADRQALVVAMARLAGWAAQAIEQQNSGISLLPALRYAPLDSPQAVE